HPASAPGPVDPDPRRSLGEGTEPGPERNIVRNGHLPSDDARLPGPGTAGQPQAGTVRTVGYDTQRPGHLGEVAVEVESPKRPGHDVAGLPERPSAHGRDLGRGGDRVRIAQRHAGSLCRSHPRALKTEPSPARPRSDS